MAAAMCQALPSFYSDYCTKSLFISVSSDFYKKYIVSHDYCVSTHSLCSLKNCEFHLVLIGISLSQIFQRLDKYVYIYIKKLTVFTLCSNTDSIQVLLRQAEKSSINLDEQFNITYDGKEPKRCLVLQRNE